MQPGWLSIVTHVSLPGFKQTTSSNESLYCMYKQMCLHLYEMTTHEDRVKSLLSTQETFQPCFSSHVCMYVNKQIGLYFK